MAGRVPCPVSHTTPSAPAEPRSRRSPPLGDTSGWAQFYWLGPFRDPSSYGDFSAHHSVVDQHGKDPLSACRGDGVSRAARPHDLVEPVSLDGAGHNMGSTVASKRANGSKQIKRPSRVRFHGCLAVDNSLVQDRRAPSVRQTSAFHFSASSRIGCS
jgi:hypothetical protein